MKKRNKNCNKFIKGIRLSAVWVVRILLAKSHFKVPFYKRVFYAINGGYTVDQIALYNLTLKNKKNYLSEFDWYKSRYINEPYSFILNNKLICSDLLKQYIDVPTTICIKKNDIIYSYDNSVNNIDDIINLIRKQTDLYIKPIGVGKGIGVFKIEYKGDDFYIDYKKIPLNNLKTFLLNKDNWFMSTSIKQAKFLNEIYNKTTNTIRLITVRNSRTNKCEVLNAVQRIGTKETIPVDNGSRGGLVAMIDIKTGILSSAKSIQKICDYKTHPDSNNKIEGVKIPNWESIKTEFISLMEKFPYLYFVAWDILLTDKGPVVIEANTSSGVNILQLWSGQRNDKVGNFYKDHKIIK